MSKVVIAVLSFIAGMLVSSLWGHQTAPAPKPRESSQRILNVRPDGRPRMRIDEAAMRGVSEAVKLPDAVVPGVVDINLMPIFDQAIVTGSSSGSSQTLDGFDCRHCSFENVRFKYGGGSFNLEGATVRGTVSVEYTGAAANTIAMVGLMQSLGLGNPLAPRDAGRTIKKTIRPKQPRTFDFSPPFVSGT